MPRARPRYPPEFRQQMVELVRAGLGGDRPAEDGSAESASPRSPSELIAPISISRSIDLSHLCENGIGLRYLFQRLTFFTFFK